MVAQSRGTSLHLLSFKEDDSVNFNENWFFMIDCLMNVPGWYRYVKTVSKWSEKQL